MNIGSVSGGVEAVRSRRGAAPAAPASDHVVFRPFAGSTGLRAIRAEWDAVAGGLSRPRFHHLYPWHQAYVDYLAPDPGSVRFFVGYADRRPVAIFPLVSAVRRIGGVPVRTLELPGHDHVPMRDAVFDPTTARRGLVADFVAHLRREVDVPSWDVLVMDAMLDDSAAWTSLCASPPPRMVTERGRAVDYLECTSFEAKLGSLARNFRASLRKSRNKLAREPHVELVRAEEPRDVPFALEQFLTVESSGWKGAARSAIASDARLTAFYRSVAHGFTASGGCEINLLRVAGKCIAAQFCLRVDRTLYILKIGYDESYSRLAPGNMLLEHVLRRCASERDIDIVNLASDASWHADWRPASEGRHRAMVFNDSVRGRLAYVFLQAKGRVRPLYRKYVRPHLETTPSRSKANALETALGTPPLSRRRRK